MKRYLAIILWITGTIAGLFLLFICVVWATEWRPGRLEVIDCADESTPPLPDTLTVLIWNTGYAGLGSGMDFFMDGGRRTRAPREDTEENLLKIKEFLASSGADIILLQEVDRDARRSYRIDQFAAYREALPGYHGYFALNYKSPFVPIPVRAPLGKVEAGLAIFTKIRPREAVRYQYPSRFAFPQRLFNLKRCLLSARFATASGREIMIGNTHNTAYDTGNMRTQEMLWLRDELSTSCRADILSITGGDWNQNPPGYTPSAAEVNDPCFSPLPIRDDLFPPGWRFVSGTEATNRYLYEPLTPSTTRTVLDLFLISPGVECLGVEVVDLGFQNSDHNPVMATFLIGLSEL